MKSIATSLVFSLGLLAMAGVQAEPVPVAVVKKQIEAITPGSVVTCTTTSTGAASCKADGWRADVAGCGEGAEYGAVTNKAGVDLHAGLNGKGAVTAHLQKGQFVCVAASAHQGEDNQRFIVAVATSSVADCKGKDLCRNADHPIQWKAAQPKATCNAARGDYAACAAGWVSLDDVDSYSNGL
ncbi:hypothetical protein KPL74_10820 [Bacillus sp. NP157]|nr:hypothetical protein KPL74_10820 [Bacillus sp. NP157]